MDARLNASLGNLETCAVNCCKTNSFILVFALPYYLSWCAQLLILPRFTFREIRRDHGYLSEGYLASNIR